MKAEERLAYIEQVYPDSKHWDLMHPSKSTVVGWIKELIEEKEEYAKKEYDRGFEDGKKSRLEVKVHDLGDIYMDDDLEDNPTQKK